MGCRSRAKQDLYVEKLTSELRLLEDQLYQADYENRILAEKLQRQNRQRGTAAKRPTAPSADIEAPIISPPAAAMPVPDPIPHSSVAPRDEPLVDPDDVSSDTRDTGAGPDEDLDVDPDDLMDPDNLVDPGDLIDEGELTTPPAEVPTDPFTDDDPPYRLPQDLPAPPGEPEPPGRRDLEIPPIDPGQILPPPANDAPVEDPPGRVPLPETLRELGHGKTDPNLPDSLSLHSGFSGPQHFGNEQKPADQIADGMMLVINVHDRRGRMMKLSDMDIDATLSIVALDPSKPGDEARIARWDFTPDEVSTLVQDAPVSGLHVPVVWDTAVPESDEIIVHVRLQAGDDRMTCQGLVRMKSAVRTARWTPRGDATKPSTAKANVATVPFKPTRR